MAGDTATRELICGGFTGGGSHNAAWAISSGVWAGAAEAVHARSVEGRRVIRMYTAALARTESRGMHKRADPGHTRP